MKKGLNFHLKIILDDTDLDNVEKVEFIFKPKSDSTTESLKKSIYPGEVTRNGNMLLIPFYAEETYNLPKVIFMDTRIKLKDTSDQPETNIIKLAINPTLFNEEDSNDIC